MPRILGVDIPNDKPTHISLRYIYGVGATLALRLCEQARIDPQRRARELTDDEISRLNVILDKEYTVEGPLKRQVSQNIARLRDIGCYRGVRHRRGLPVRGQRPRTNARTRALPVICMSRNSPSSISRNSATARRLARISLTRRRFHTHALTTSRA
jgi:small subunit ribosomal protein S13